MFIEIEDLRDEPLHVEHVYGPDALVFKRDDAALIEPVAVDFVLTHQGGDLQVDGTVDTELRCRCARCASEFRRQLAARFNISYLPQPAGVKESEEIELKYEDMDIGFYDGIRLDVDLMVMEQIELSLPMKFVCREECRGLCYRCGKDLNEGPCSCPQEAGDPRLSVLLEFKKRTDT